MREIVLDTETTGLDPKGGHRIVEIGCVELDNHMPTGETYHQYINPRRDMPDEAFRIHGLSQEYLSDFPEFSDIASAFVEFIGDAKLIIHNASFDMGFINAELNAHDLDLIPMDRATDTVALARRKFPGARANLDALCQRFGIDNSNRDLHGALLDARLLADVYLELIGGRQPDLALKSEKQKATTTSSDRVFKEARPHAPTADELAAHKKFVAQLDDPVWATD